MLVREVSETEKEEFNKLALHITQSWQWGSFRLQEGSVVNVSRLGFFDGAQLCRAYQIFFHRVPYLNKLIAYLPRSPLPANEDLAAITKICRDHGAIYLKLEPEIPAGTPINLFGLRPAKPILPPHTLQIDLTMSREDILAGMREKTRYNIKVATKNGVTVAQKDDPESLEAFIKLHNDTQLRQGFYAKSDGYLQKLWGVLHPAKMVYLLCAYAPNETEPLAALMLFYFNSVLYFPYGGWAAKKRELMPNNLLHFEAIKLGQNLGAKTYDLWSSYKEKPLPSDPWYGTYVFKKGFGGKEVDFAGAFDLPLNQPMYLAAQWADKVRWPVLKFKRLLRI